MLAKLKRDNPERMAWLILMTSFTIFCLLAVSIPFSVRWYILNATEPFSTEATSVRGTVSLGDPQAELSASLTDGMTTPIEESFTVTTDETSQAILTFFDDSSLTMYGNTSITLAETQKTRFNVSSNPTRITIQVQRGRVRATAARNREALHFDLITPHARIELDQGSFSIEVSEQGTQVTVRLGQADVLGEQQIVTVTQGKRVVVTPDLTPSEPLPAAQNLLKNSEFGPQFQDSWQVYQLLPIAGVTTTVQAVQFQDRYVLQLNNQGQDNLHSETGVMQEVNKDVRDFRSLQIFAEVRLARQSLPGGGQLGSEFPIMLHVAYKDANNNDRDWFHGFYYTPPPPNYVLYNQPDNSSERIARFIWYPYESVNLLTTLGPTKPVFIKSIRIYASGWLYEAMVANISLLAQE
ncbi:MAG: FecR family protein [Chloroflexota bacterium]